MLEKASSLLVVLSLLAAAACGDSEGSDGSDGQGAGSAQGGDGQGASGQGGDGAGGKAPEEYLGYGAVGVFSYDYTLNGMPLQQSGAYASYGLNGTARSTCMTTQVGDCTVYACDPSNGQMPTALSAGVATVSGGQWNVTLTPSGTEYQTVTNTNQALFAGGETLAFDVVGEGQVPPHQGTVVAPHPVTVSGFSSADSLTHDRSTPFTVNWSGGGAGTVNVAIGYSEISGGEVVKSYSIQCYFDPTAGTGTIPAEALSMVPATAPQSSAGLSVGVASTTNVEAGDFLVTFLASTLALDAAGEQATALITLQ